MQKSQTPLLPHKKYFSPCRFFHCRRVGCVPALRVPLVHSLINHFRRKFKYSTTSSCSVLISRASLRSAHTVAALPVDTAGCAFRWFLTVRGAAQSIDERGCSRPRAALRMSRPSRMTVARTTTRCACHCQSGGRHPSSALDLCGCPQLALLATRRRHGGQVQEHVCRHALHARAAGLDAADHLLCEVAVCTRLCD